MPESRGYRIDASAQPHESAYLKLDCSKARQRLGWCPRWSLDQALESVAQWATSYGRKEDVKDVCLRQIEAYNKVAQEA